MLTQLRPTLTLFALLTITTGLLYPFVVTSIALGSYEQLANGSVIVIHGKTYGSELIGQNFSAPGYFWGRPSATGPTPYTAFNSETLTGSSGSNLGPLSQTLVDDVQTRVEALHAADPQNSAKIPVDLVTASASGLDPHISVAAAEYQIPRVARERGLPEEAVRHLVEQHTKSRQFGLFGEPRVNVLLLNLALAGLK